MNQILRIAAVVSISTFASGAFAQEAAPANPMAATSSVAPKNTITINPLPLVIGMVSMEYERATSESLSLYVAPSYWSLSLGTDADEFSVFAYGLGLGARYFMTGVAPEGFWVAPGVELAFAGAEYRGAEGSGIGYGIGAQLGYTWLIGNVFDISLGIGANYTDSEVEVEYEEAGVERTRIDGNAGVYPSLRFALGAAF